MEADRIPTQQSELVQAASVSGNPPVADVRKEDQSNPCMVKDSGGRSAVHDYLGQVGNVTVCSCIVETPGSL